jgi:hypothetical protein
MKSTIKEVFNSWYFRSAVAGGVAAALFMTADILYAGIAMGIGIRELFLAFSNNDKCECGCEHCCGNEKEDKVEMLKS